MQDFLENIFTNCKDFFKSLDTNSKIALISTSLILVAVMSSLIIWAAKTQYKLLYNDLSKEDAASISQMLEDGKITYQVKDDGKSLYVPEDQVEKWRLEIAKKGVYRNGSTFFLYNQPFKSSFSCSSLPIALTNFHIFLLK